MAEGRGGSRGERVVRVRIEGRVQGVGFRAFVAREAVALGLDGWVRNRRDGGVEAVIAGPDGSVDELLRRCRIGPNGARVDLLREFAEGERPGPGFEVAPTQ
jgi:acylphosphatase